MSFRDNLLHLRATNNMTQEQLAMLLGVSRQSVTKWESEKSYPEMDKLLKLCQVFDCTLDELVQGDLTGREPMPQAAASGQGPAVYVFDYDRFMRRFATRLSLGILAAIAGVGIAIPFLAASDPGANPYFGLSENLAAALGMFVLFAGVGICLALIIPAAMAYSAFVKAHPFIEDFYTSEDRAKARSLFAYQLVGGIGIIFLGICAVVLFGETAEGSLVGVTAMMLCIAVGVFLIVHGAMTLGRTNIAEYNANAAEHMEVSDIEAAKVPDEAKQEMLNTKRLDQKVGAVCGTIMILATAIALLMLFWPMATGTVEDYTSGTIAFFWLPWPIGGLLCGIAAMLIKAFGKAE